MGNYFREKNDEKSMFLDEKRIYGDEYLCKRTAIAVLT